MVLRGRCRRVVARWVACVVAVGACVMGAGVPASVGDPLPTPSVPVAASPETPVLPGHVVTIRAVVEPTTIKTPDGTYQWSIHMGMAFYGEKSQGEKFAQEDCQFLADTFWSGSAPDYFVKVESRGVFCNLDAYYLGEARHAFYSLDEAGHVQVRAPMTYLTQIADSFEDASITELQVDFTSINNAHCNAEPWLAHLDDLLVVGHWSYCQWRTDKGDTVPTTDEPLLEGDVEQAFFDFKRGTVGPFRACQFFCVWGLEVGGDSVGVGGGELGEGLFPVGGGVSLDEAGVSCSFVGGFAGVCEALGGSFVFDVADG